MRILLALVVFGLLGSVVSAEAQPRGGSIQGFGGTTFGTTASAPTFGAALTVPLGDHMQIVGEAGRLTDIKAPLLDNLLGFTPVDVTLSAWYGEAGLRFAGSRRAAVRPYVEATAGIARLTPGVALDGWGGAMTNTGLSFLGRTEPLVGAGAGVMLQSGPLALDVGYRYKRIVAGSGISSAFALGNGFNVNQVRVGVGVRF